jgi:TonB-linked SusC/RagA family outer membrane protein
MLNKNPFQILCFLFLFLSISWTFSQKSISGKVTGFDNFDGLPGVNVFVQGTTIGTVTDFEGNYTIQVPSDSIRLVFSFVGYLTEEYEIHGLTNLDVTLMPSIEYLDEVVVTALGLKREEKALGYSIQKVEGDKVSQVKELDVVNALSGKVAGVNIIQGGGGIGGGGSRIVIRGETSLAGNNDPLFIINGIPGNPNDIAPDDIESISVLKGPAAAALYGSKAGAGVVLITSKSGRSANGLQVEVSSNNTFQTPLVLPEYQDKYGMGSGGAYQYLDGNTNDEPYWDDTRFSWGPEFDGQPRDQFNGTLPWVAHPDNVKDFYQTGHIFVNNIALSNANEKNNYRFSYSHTGQKGILPNTGLKKDNLALNTHFDVFNKLSVSSNLNYIRTNCPNQREVDVRFIPRGTDIEALKKYWVPGLEGMQQMNYRRSGNNPYFLLYEAPQSYIDNRVLLNVTANYNPFKGFNVLGRFGSNYTNNEFNEKQAKSTYSGSNPRSLTGFYANGMNNHWDRTAEFLASFEKEALHNLTVKLSFGGTHYRQEYKSLYANTFDLHLTDIFNLNNRDAYLNNIGDEISKLERNSLYGFLNIDYKGMAFLDITRRDDWSSTLHPNNNHFSYPSVATSLIVTEILQMPRFLSFWKLKANYAQVGNDIPRPYFTIEEKYFFDPRSNGLSYIVPHDTRTDPYLVPELSSGIEAGTDIRFFNNRLGIDFTYYQTKTEKQILKIEISGTTGFDFQTLNGGLIEAKGVELVVNAKPVKNDRWTWDIQMNWSRDRTSIVELIDSLPNYSKTQQVNSFLAIEDRPGQRRGTFYGRSYERAPNGKKLYSLSGDTRLTEATQLGNYNPDWMASLSNNISYKNLELSFLLDLRYGGLIYNETERLLNFWGLSEATLFNNRQGIVTDGMVEENGSYRELTLADLEKFGKTGGQSGQEYWANQMEEVVPENTLVDDTFLKLRELRLSYQLPHKWLDKTVVKSLSLSLVGRNLAVWSKVKHVDPETFGYAAENNDFGFSTKVPGYANARVPSVRSYGFSINCKF